MQMCQFSNKELGGLLALRRIVGWWDCHLAAVRHAVGLCLSGTYPGDRPAKGDPTRSKLQTVSLPGSMEHTSPLATTRPDPRGGEKSGP